MVYLLDFKEVNFGGGGGWLWKNNNSKVKFFLF